jgi:hypothetical protein
LSLYIYCFKFYWQCKHETHYLICISCYFTFSNHTIFKNDHFNKYRLNFNALSINRTELDLKMLIQDETNESGLWTPCSILKCTNSLGRPTWGGADFNVQSMTLIIKLWPRFKIYRWPRYEVSVMCNLMGNCRFRKMWPTVTVGQVIEVANCDRWPGYRGVQL